MSIPEALNLRAGMRRRDDAGFTLLEVVVAIVLLGIVAAAAAPILVTGMRSGVGSKYLTQARLLAEERIDIMRNLPFNVPPSSGPYIDVLDNYYTNNTAPGTAASCGSPGSYTLPATTWTGFIAAGTSRCGYEPATGALYRKVIQPGAPYPNFIEVVDTQFLDASRAAVGPASCGYNTQSTDPCQYTPITELLGITVTIVYTQFGPTKAYSYFTELTDSGDNKSLIVTKAHSDAVKAVLGTANGRLTVEAGDTDQAGQLFNAPLVNAGATAMEADFGGANPSDGAYQTAASPPDVSGLSASGGALDPFSGLGSCVFVCWGSNNVSNVGASSSTRVPLAGTPGSPVTASMPASAVTQTSAPGLQISNQYLDTSHLMLDPSRGLVRFANPSGGSQSASNCAFSPSGANTLFQSTSYLDASNGNSTHYVDACATAQAMTLDVLPTTFAPNGLVQVTLAGAAARCKINVAGGTPTPTTQATFNATVTVNAKNGPITKTISAGVGQGDALSGIPMSTIVYQDNGTTLTLGDYFQAMNSTPDGTVTTAGSTDVQLDVPGIVLLTQPLQDSSAPSYLSSVMSLVVGSLECEAKDAR